jgi:hypothetical protein
MQADRIPPTPSGPNDSAARALARVGWTKVWRRLYRYATTTLGFAAIDAKRAGVVEAADLVNTLLVLALLGRLDWNLPEHATEVQIIHAACTKLYGMRSNLRRNAAWTVHDDALDERPDPCADALARLMEARGLAALERLFEHDAEASAHLEEMLDRKTRQEIAEKLGCTLLRVDTVRKRIVRAIAAYARSANDDSEDAGPARPLHSRAPRVNALAWPCLPSLRAT